MSCLSSEKHGGMERHVWALDPENLWRWRFPDGWVVAKEIPTSLKQPQRKIRQTIITICSSCWFNCFMHLTHSSTRWKFKSTHNTNCCLLWDANSFYISNKSPCKLCVQWVHSCSTLKMWNPATKLISCTNIRLFVLLKSSKTKRPSAPYSPRAGI